MIKGKIKASLIHFLLSIVIVTLVLAAVILLWYPTKYIGITNFKSIAILIISIDLVLGPLLTLVIFNPNKKSLRFDLAVVAAIQIAALIYGIHALYQTHPTYITFNHGKFNLIHANEVKPSNSKYDEFKVSTLSSPKLAFAKMPDDPKLQTEIILSVDLKGEPDIDKRTEYYEPYQNHMDNILSNSLDKVKLFDEENMNDSSKAFLKKYGNKDNYSFLPLQGPAGSAIMVLDKETANVVTTIKAEPWKFVQK